ncbi:MAG: Hsp20/alpha crystallin family protein [Clostridia bacterium]
MSIFGLTPYKTGDVGNYFDDFEKRFLGFQSMTGMAGFRTDILDNGDHYQLEAELPGFNKEDIDIHIEGDYLVIAAKHEDRCEDKHESYVRRERSYGSYQRSFDMTGIDASAIGAKYENGILKLKLPKQVEQPAEQRKIDIQ